MSDPADNSRSARTGRFQKGRSGNPKGRPRKRTAPAEATQKAFEILRDKRVTVTQGGVERELSVEEALQLRTVEDAFAGKPAAMREALEMVARRDKAIAKLAQRTVPSVTVRYEPTEPRNADAAMCLLGIASPDNSLEEYPDALLLEPWAVQAALNRRRGGEGLLDRHITFIKNCTRAAETLRWPRSTES